jgi:hypothetical protein
LFFLISPYIHFLTAAGLVVLAAALVGFDGFLTSTTFLAGAELLVALPFGANAGFSSFLAATFTGEAAAVLLTETLVSLAIGALVFTVAFFLAATGGVETLVAFFLAAPLVAFGLASSLLAFGLATGAVTFGTSVFFSPTFEALATVAFLTLRAEESAGAVALVALVAFEALVALITWHTLEAFELLEAFP